MMCDEGGSCVDKVAAKKSSEDSPRDFNPGAEHHLQTKAQRGTRPRTTSLNTPLYIPHTNICPP
jgi:hypothetical protein